MAHPFAHEAKTGQERADERYGHDGLGKTTGQEQPAPPEDEPPGKEKN